MEKYRKNVYCEKQFLKSYFQKIKDDCGDSNQRQLLNSIKDIITNPYVKLYIDFTEEDVEYNAKLFETNMDKSKISDYDRFMYEMFQKQTNNEIQLKSYQKKDFEDVEKIDLNALYLTDSDTESCNKLRNDYGIFAVNIEDLDKYNFVLKDQGKAIAKRDSVFKSWQHVFRHTNFLPCNAMIIIDNYLLNNTSSYTENIESILDMLIPNKLNISFHIAIITSLGENNKNKNNNLPCKSRYERIKNYIESIRPNLNFEFTIFKRNPDYKDVGTIFHDRTILTNSMFIGCGAGFDLFKDRMSQKTTVVNIVTPLLSIGNIEWGNAAYSNLINDIKDKVWNNNNVQQFDGDRIGESMHSFYIGNKSNRIIE